MLVPEDNRYPPWWRKSAAARKLLLSQAVSLLHKKLKEYPKVHGALIYGSYATDSVGPDSDLDIMVIADSDLPQLERMTPFYQELRLGVAFDLVVYTPAEFERLKRTRGFVAQAAREGIWLDAG